MYLYRAMSSEELINRLNGIEKNKTNFKGENTFNYKENIDYMHFFKYSAHAFSFRDKCMMACVAKVELKDELIPPLEYGLYADIETYYDDSLTKYYIPLPEIIVDRKLIKNSNIIAISNTLTGSFDEVHTFQSEFWVSQKRPFQKEEQQLWSQPSVYYEYIKSLLPKFDYNTMEIAKYLKTINLDDELNKISEKIEKNKILTKRRLPRIEKKFYY